MGTFPLAVTGLSSNDPVPGAYLEVLFAQGEVAGDPSVPKVLFTGPKTSAGSATPDTTVYPLGGVADAVTYFGARSPVTRMIRRFVEQCKSAVIYGAAVTESAGVAATGSVHFTSTAASVGVVNFTLCGETIQTAIAKSTTPTGAATALKNDINLQTYWPVTATSSGATVKLAAAVKGTNGNMIRYRASMTGSGVTMTCTAAAATLTAGATDESYTNVLAAVASDKYSYIVPGINNAAATSDTRVGAIKTQVISQAQPLTGIRQQVVLGHGGSSAQVATYCAATNGPANQPRFCVAWQPVPEWEPMEIAAHLAGLRYAYETVNPVQNFDGWGKQVNGIWNVPKEYLASDWPTRANIAAAISAGATPIAVLGGTRTYLVRCCTASTDVRVRDTAKVTEADRFTDDVGARFVSQWTGANVQDDPSNDNVQVAPAVCTPKRLKDLTIKPVYIAHAKAGWLDSAKTLDAPNGDLFACTAGLDPNNVTRINARMPIHVMPLLHQFAGVVSENSSA